MATVGTSTENVSVTRRPSRPFAEQPSRSLGPRQLMACFLSLWVTLRFLEFPTKGHTVRLASFSGIIMWRLIQVLPVSLVPSLLLLRGIPACGRPDVVYPSPAYGHLGRCCFGTHKDAAVNICVSLSVVVLHSSWVMEVEADWLHWVA